MASFAFLLCLLCLLCLLAFAVLHDFGAGPGIDGKVLDSEGRIWATAGEGERTGVYVFSPTGALHTPETAMNCTFGGLGLSTL